MANRALEPLRQLARTTAEIASTGDFQRRLPSVESNDEVGALTESFNAMLDRLADSHRQLEESLERQRRFVADASHELRNPLTIIRSNLTFLEMRPQADPDDLKAALSDSSRAARRMTDLIDDLLRLARLDAGQLSPQRTRFGLPGRARSVERSGLLDQINVDIKGDAMVTGSDEDLTRIVTNLIENAITHGKPPINVSIEHAEGSGTITVTAGRLGPGHTRRPPRPGIRPVLPRRRSSQRRG